MRQKIAYIESDIYYYFGFAFYMLFLISYINDSVDPCSITVYHIPDIKSEFVIKNRK